MIEDRKPQNPVDVLALIYFVVGGISILAGIAFLLLALFDGGYFAGGAAIIGILCCVGGLLWVTEGSLLRKRKKRSFCIAIAVFSIPVFIPIGTVLGVYTIMLLCRREVEEDFIRGQLTGQRPDNRLSL